MEDEDFKHQSADKRAQARKTHLKSRQFRAKGRASTQHLHADAAKDGERTGIIAGAEGGVFIVMEQEIPHECTVAKKGRSDLAKHLVIGDRVIFSAEGQETGTIVARQKRGSWIVRMRGDKERGIHALEEHAIAANVDIAVIVVAAASPPFHQRFIDRYLVVLQKGHVVPVICLNKVDLTAERHPILSFYRESGIPVVETSITAGTGMPQLEELLQGKTAVFIGQSGVGKSSISNAFMPDADTDTGEVSGKSDKGRHTTTTSNLYAWRKDSYIIDTPGIRSLGIEHIEKETIRFFFPEFEELEAHCQYTDCMHDHEPLCAVKDAAAGGSINPYRYESYLRMLHE